MSHIPNIVLGGHLRKAGSSQILLMSCQDVLQGSLAHCGIDPSVSLSTRLQSSIMAYHITLYVIIIPYSLSPVKFCLPRILPSRWRSAWNEDGDHTKPPAIARLKTATDRLAHEPMSMGFVRPVAAWMVDHRVPIE
jgi:hypothetical protein